MIIGLLCLTILWLLCFMAVSTDFGSKPLSIGPLGFSFLTAFFFWLGVWAGSFL